MLHSLTIGRLAKKSAVSIDSIRFYERRGLLAEPARTEANFRIYPPGAADRLSFSAHTRVPVHDCVRVKRQRLNMTNEENR